MKLLIIGLDCADTELVFEWKDELPNLKKLIEGGAYGPLHSTHPPITVPAWAVMICGIYIIDSVRIRSEGAL